MAGKIQRYREAKSKKPIKFVYFDIGNVLLTYTDGVTVLAEVLHAPVEEVYNFWVVRDDALNLGTLTRKEFWRQLKTHFGYRGQDIDVLDLWMQYNHPIKESHALVRKISRTHKVGLLSNAMPRTVAKTRKLGLIPRIRFASVIESSAFGIIKPDPKIYAIAQQRAGVAAGEILYIDDNEINLLQAHKSGFHTYHFDSDNPTASVKELERVMNL